jgi:Zn ribbon nucleic-acid-binding protein
LIELERKGLIKGDKYIECPHCHNLMNIIYCWKLMNDNELECTQCGADLSEQDLKKYSKYKLNKEAHVMQKGETIEFSDRLSKKLPSYLYDNYFKNTHLLRYFSTDPVLKEKRPFQGMKFLILLHFLADIVPFIEAAEILGLDLRESCFFF